MSASAGAGDRTAAGSLDVRWIHGSPAPKYNTDPDIQVHGYDEHTYVLRQNMAVHWEAPFMFLLFGHDRAVLLDTGPTAEPEFFPLRATVDAVIGAWTADHQHAGDYGLLVLHTHPHGDHTAADGQFTGRPHTQVVGAKRETAWPFFGFTAGQESVVGLDLGGRVIDCLDTPGQDYPIGWAYQPDEPPLQLTPGHLQQIQDTLRAHGLSPGRYVLPEMIIDPR